MLQRFLALLRARNLEFFRDKAALTWAFVFPLLIIIGCALVFSDPNPSVFRIGLHGDVEQLEAEAWLRADYLQRVPFDDLGRGQERVRHHQLDLLVSNGSEPRYWLNPESGNSRAARDLLAPHLDTFEATPLSGRAVRYVDWVIPGVLAMNMMFASLFGVGYVIVRYRQNGVLKRLQATPVSAVEFIGAQLTSRLLIVVSVNAMIFIGCDLFLDLLVLGDRTLLLLVAVAGGLAMISLGLLIACRSASEELAGGMLNVATWPMLFLSEVWFSLETAPAWLRLVSDLLPLTHIVQAARAVMVEGASLGDILHHLLALLAMTLLFTAIAARLFRWHAGR